MKIILSVRGLAWTLGVPLDRLRKIADSPGDYYHEFTRWKDASKTHARMIRHPNVELKAIQKLIKDRILNGFQFGSEVQGGIRGRSPKSNAETHLGAEVLVTVDVRKFFDSVDHRLVFRTLRELGYGSGVARLITKLTTRNGLLPQGAPTSVLLGNLVLARSVDAPTQDQARKASVSFTRYIDDVGLSGCDPARFIGYIANRFSGCGLSIHRGRKLKIQPRSRPQRITGLNVNSGRPTVPRTYRDNVRAAIQEWASITASEGREKAARRIEGRIAYIRQFQPGPALRLSKQLARVRR